MDGKIRNNYLTRHFVPCAIQIKQWFTLSIYGSRALIETELKRTIDAETQWECEVEEKKLSKATREDIKRIIFEPGIFQRQ